jgi:hypothetical protein
MPAFCTISADLDLRDLAMTAPSNTRDTIVAGPYLHHPGWQCDDRIRLHPKLELSGFATGEQLRVARRFPARHPWLISKL